ncbi:MAG: T9SS type A sorting domain-containing protein [Bacteroidetes bacterium]|nr:T9SS type A sorting domain-containing protein [Bacteroidota bacterium]
MKKKATAIKIQIPEPCTQDFSKMHPLPGGRYCDHCERTVVDFRGMTDREIVRIYQQRQGRVCGIFQDQQLNRALPLPQPPKEGKPWAAIAALSSALLFGNPANGQSKIEQNPIQQLDKASKERPPTPLEGKVTIEGWVLGDKGESLPFATILLADGHGTETGFDGYFKVEIPVQLIGTTVIVSCMGYESKSIIIEKANTIDLSIEVELKFGLTLNTVVVTYERPLIEHDWTGGGGMSTVYQNFFGEEEIEIKVDNRIHLTIYPNPFISQLTIEMEVKTAQPYLFHLYNEAGQLVFAEARNLETGLQTLQLDLVQRHLPEGAYFLRISDDAGEIRTKRLVKVSP